MSVVCVSVVCVCSRCNNLISDKIIKGMSGSVASGTPCISVFVPQLSGTQAVLFPRLVISPTAACLPLP